MFSAGLAIETLSIRCLNKNAVQVRGTFRCGDTRPVLVTDNSVSIAGIPMNKKHCAIIDSKAPYGIAYEDRALAKDH